MSALWITAALVGLLGHIVLHEAAHALALRRSIGGDISSAGLGLPLGPVLEIMRHGKTFTLSPWLIGAYVMPDKRSERLIEGAPYVKQAWFAGAGVIANLIAGMLIWAVLDIVLGDWVSAAIYAGLTIVVWVARKVITFALPVIGIALLAYLTVEVARSFGEPQGPVGIVVAVSEMATSGMMVLKLLGAIGIGLAMVNSVPIFPFDGGRVADAALRHLFGHRVSHRYQIITGVVTGLFLVYAVGSDAWYLVAR